MNLSGGMESNEQRTAASRRYSRPANPQHQLTNTVIREVLPAGLRHIHQSPETVDMVRFQNSLPGGEFQDRESTAEQVRTLSRELQDPGVQEVLVLQPLLQEDRGEPEDLESLGVLLVFRLRFGVPRLSLLGLLEELDEEIHPSQSL